MFPKYLGEDSTLTINCFAFSRPNSQNKVGEIFDNSQGLKLLTDLSERCKDLVLSGRHVW